MRERVGEKLRGLSPSSPLNKKTVLKTQSSSSEGLEKDRLDQYLSLRNQGKIPKSQAHGAYETEGDDARGLNISKVLVTLDERFNKFPAGKTETISRDMRSLFSPQPQQLAVHRAPAERNRLFDFKKVSEELAQKATPSKKLFKDESRRQLSFDSPKRKPTQDLDSSSRVRRFSRDFEFIKTPLSKRVHPIETTLGEDGGLGKHTSVPSFFDFRRREETPSHRLEKNGGTKISNLISSPHRGIKSSPRTLRDLAPASISLSIQNPRLQTSYSSLELRRPSEPSISKESNFRKITQLRAHYNKF